MKAIMTKYMGPTNYNGARIKAWEPDGKSVTLSWDYGMDGEGNAKWAAQELCKKMNWTGNLICGWLKDGYVFVFEDK